MSTVDTPLPMCEADLFFFLLDCIANSFCWQLRQAPSFFANAPLVLDLGGVGGAVSAEFLDQLVSRVRQLDFRFVGVTHATPAMLPLLEERFIPVLSAKNRLAAPSGAVQTTNSGRTTSSDQHRPMAAGQPVTQRLVDVAITSHTAAIPSSLAADRAPKLRAENSTDGDDGDAETEESPGFSAAASTSSASLSSSSSASSSSSSSPSPSSPPSAALVGPMIITGSVRSGQQVYARGRDLVVLGSANPGSEVMSDGSIFIYGTLGGRAMAGLGGADSARSATVIAGRMRPELVAVGGVFANGEEVQTRLTPLIDNTNSPASSPLTSSRTRSPPAARTADSTSAPCSE